MAAKLNERQRPHYLALLKVVKGASPNDIWRAADKMTGMRWRGTSKSELAYYYATAKVPDRLGCTFPQAARIDLKALAKELQ